MSSPADRFELGLGAGSAMGPDRGDGRAAPLAGRGGRCARRTRSGSSARSGAARSRSSSRGATTASKALHPGPPPAHPIGIWVGAYKPRMLALTGRLADGWVPVGALRAARSASRACATASTARPRRPGRDPSEIRRIYNVVGSLENADPSRIETATRRTLSSDSTRSSSGRSGDLDRADRARRGGGRSARVGARRAAAGAALPAAC